MENILGIVLLVLLLLAIGLIIIFRNKHNNSLPEMQRQIMALQTNLAKIESNLKEDFKINREENAGLASNNRYELTKNITDFSAANIT